MSRRCSLLHVRMLFLLLVSYSKSCSSNSIQENLKLIQTRWNVYDVENYSQKWMRPMHLHKRVCLYFHSLCKKSLGRCARVAQKHFAPMEFKSLHIWFSLPDKRLISDWFSDTLSTSVMHSPFVAFLIEAARRTSSWYSSKSSGLDLTSRVISPIINVTLHRGLKSE